MIDCATRKTTSHLNGAKSLVRPLAFVTGKTRFLTSPFCGEAVNKNHITKERKDPENPQDYQPICDICCDAYISKQVIGPFYRNCEKLRGAVLKKEADYTEMSTRYNLVYGEVQNKNVIVSPSFLTLDCTANTYQ